VYQYWWDYFFHQTCWCVVSLNLSSLLVWWSVEVPQVTSSEYKYLQVEIFVLNLCIYIFVSFASDKPDVCPYEHHWVHDAHGNFGGHNLKVDSSQGKSLVAKRLQRLRIAQDAVKSHSSFLSTLQTPCVIKLYDALLKAKINFEFQHYQWQWQSKVNFALCVNILQYDAGLFVSVTWRGIYSMLLLGVKDGTRHNRTNLLFSLFHLLSIVLCQLFLQHLGEDFEPLARRMP